MEAASADIAMLCFVLSAVAPHLQSRFLAHVWAALKPSGLLLFRDYADGDLAQKRFRPVSGAYNRQRSPRMQYNCTAKIGWFTFSQCICFFDVGQLNDNQTAKIAEEAEEYVRHDGTLTYFFTEAELCALVEEQGFVVVKVSYIEKEVVNRAQGLEMGRRWLQLVARKPKRRATRDIV